jgi:NhaP-type Na+/H+ or K+/H+ antiporter
MLCGGCPTRVSKAERRHVSGVVAVLTAGLTLSALGPARVSPKNWSFLSELWEQIAFWARSLIFVSASILVPRLLTDIDLHDVLLLGVLIADAFAARAFALFGRRVFEFMHRNALPATEFFRIPPNRVIELGGQVDI